MQGSNPGSRPEASLTRTAPGNDGIADRQVAVHRIVVLHCPDRDAVGRSFLLGRQPCPVGRATAGPVGIGLADPELSSVHATLVPGSERFAVLDQGSRNGTFVDGRRVEEEDLGHGAVIRVGGSVLLYENMLVPEDLTLAPEVPPLMGRSVATQQLRAEIDRLAPRNITVLIQGETGVGKEVVARTLHERSGRPGPFVPVNCGALPADLVEAELFGNVAGAFTSAERARDGLFVAADGGTILLDEVGEMPLVAQPALLRVLATGEVRPVGATEPRRVDVRVVAATNRDLRARVEQGRFRGDLHSRLRGWNLPVLPLRERRADIPSLARHFLGGLGAPEGFSADVAEALCLHDWPGNVRDLEQAVSASVVRSGGDPLALAHLDAELSVPLRRRREGAGAEGEPQVPLALRVDRHGVPDRDQLALVLRQMEGNVARVAEFFGKDRRQVYRWLARHDLDIDELR